MQGLPRGVNTCARSCRVRLRRTGCRGRLRAAAPATRPGARGSSEETRRDSRTAAAAANETMSLPSMAVSLLAFDDWLRQLAGFCPRSEGCGRSVTVRLLGGFAGSGGAQNLPFVGKVLRTVPSSDGLAGAVRPSKTREPIHERSHRLSRPAKARSALQAH